MNNNTDAVMEGLRVLVDRLQKTKLKVVALNNYAKLIKATNVVAYLLQESVDKAAVTVQIDTTFNLGSISVERSE